MKIKKIINMLNYATVLIIAPAAFSQQAVMDQDGIYLVCEKMPEIKGGLKALSKIIKYPKEAKKLGVQGVVYVQFIVDEKGAVVDPKLIRKLGAGCDEEALRALEKLKFNPGYVQGKPVKARFTLPIRFAL
tara:strand:+ start:120 stop:512 length:393 start_codon:yes stop_codon:yes gene_type:complete